ncbi:MAG: protein-disulfide reductase DsbD domain-containing protein, partial [Terriglobales bacterium]
GSSMLLGVHFQIPSGWHMYWVNPGDAGQSPSVQWSLPTGWTAADWQWPTPARLTNSAGVDYGYEGEVTLLTPVKVGNSGGDLTANLRWLVCKDVCIPQKGQAKASVHVGATAADSPGKQAIDAAKAKLPKTLPLQWKINAFQNPAQIVLNFRPGLKVQQAVFFPAQRDIIENAAPQKLSSTSYAAQLALKKAENKKIARLAGVLVVNGTNAYSVDVPVK